MSAITTLFRRRSSSEVNMTEGSILRHLLVFAFPLLIGNIFQQLYNLVDTWVVGNYVSNEAFAAVGSVSSVINVLIGFFSGLLIDIFYGGILGFYALLYMFLGYGNGIFHRLFLDEDIKLPMVWIGFSDLAYGLLVYFFRFMLRGQFDFGYYFVHVILPELVYTVVVTLGLYWVIRVINAWLEKGEDDSHKGYGTISAASAAALMGGTDQSEEF